MTFDIQYDFDVVGEPPKVYIADNNGYGTAYMEVFEEPTPTVEEPQDECEHWRPGPIAVRIAHLCNTDPELAEILRKEGAR